MGLVEVLPVHNHLNPKQFNYNNFISLYEDLISKSGEEDTNV